MVGHSNRGGNGDKSKSKPNNNKKNDKKKTNSNNNNDKNKSNYNVDMFPRCKFCAKTNHSSENCFFNPEKDGSKNQQKQKGGSGKQNGYDADAKCTDCGKVGHWAVSCPVTSGNQDDLKQQKGVVCENCGRTGHSTSKCRSKGSPKHGGQTQGNGSNNSDTNNNKSNTDIQNTVFNDIINTNKTIPRLNGNGSIKCTYCGVKGHEQQNCEKRKNKNGGIVKKKRAAFLDEVRRELTGITLGPGGLDVTYSLPLYAQRRAVLRLLDVNKGQQVWGQDFDDHIVDIDGDVLMCSCGHQEGRGPCLSACATDMLEQLINKDLVFTVDDRQVLEGSMQDNFSPWRNLLEEDMSYL